MSDPPEQEATPDVLVVDRFIDEPGSSAIARCGLNPSFSAGFTIQRVKRSKLFPLEITPLAKQLESQAKAVNAGDLAHGEATLTTQAATLDALFHKLIGFGLQNMSEGYGDAAERYMRLAFKAQSQCRMNWEALNEIKNPRPVAFIKQQTNVAAGHQQVNNHARGESEIPPNELKGARHGTVDTRGQTPAIGIDPGLAAVGTIDGAAIKRGQGKVRAKRR